MTALKNTPILHIVSRQISIPKLIVTTSFHVHSVAYLSSTEPGCIFIRQMTAAIVSNGNVVEKVMLFLEWSLTVASLNHCKPAHVHLPIRGVKGAMRMKFTCDKERCTSISSPFLIPSVVAYFT